MRLSTLGVSCATQTKDSTKMRFSTNISHLHLFVADQNVVITHKLSELWLVEVFDALSSFVRHFT